jgi:hypothetical protein
LGHKYAEEWTQLGPATEVEKGQAGFIRRSQMIAYHRKEVMRKFIILAISLLALAVPAAGMAAVAYDDQSVGTADKGNVMDLFDLNERQFQTAVEDGKITFSSLYQMDNNANAWTCSDGLVHKWTLRTIQSRALDVDNIVNESAHKVTGFTLNGIDESVGGTFVSGSRPNAASPYVCPTGFRWTGMVPQTMDEQFVNTVLPGVLVTYNGVTHDLPVAADPIVEPVA